MKENPSVKIEAEELEVSYSGVPALSIGGLQLSGNVIAVIGHNGAGKSTLIKTILELLTPKKGHLWISEINQEGTSSRLTAHQHMAFCPEEGAVFADISVKSYIEMWCRLKHADARYYRIKGKDLLDELDLEPLLRKLGRELSKGQRRRVQTYIGFLCNPRLFLLDEPFDGLDVQRTDQLANIIAREALNRCFLVSSHRLDVVEYLSDLVIVLKEGKVIASGKPGEVSQKLSGATLVVEGSEHQGDLFTCMSECFLGYAVRKQGRRVYLTGKSIPTEEVGRILTEKGYQIKSLLKQRPSLSEAMSYHLKY